MSKQKGSKQTLSSDFTSRVMKAATTAKRRNDVCQRFIAAIKEPFSMKSIQFLKTTPGLVVAFAVLATGSVSAYALTNWFGSDVPVEQQGTILHVDLSACKTTLPPGIDPKADKHDIQFKITGTPHVSADELQKTLLGSCESSAITKFYASQFPEARFGDTTAMTSPDSRLQYALLPAKVISVGSDTVTLAYSTGVKGTYDQQKTFPLSNNATVFNESKPSSLAALKAGDQIEFVAYAAGLTSIDETSNVTEQANVTVLSLFKTQYDVRAAEHLFDAQNNLKPLP